MAAAIPFSETPTWAHAPSTGTIRLILNPTASSQESVVKGVQDLRQQLGSRRVEVRSCWESGQARELASEAIRLAQASREDPPTVVAAGGDGTINEVLNGLIDECHGQDLAEEIPAILGVLPYGTANDFAAGIGLPNEPQDRTRAWQSLTQGSTRLVDVGRIEGRAFLNLVSGGQPAGRSDAMPDQVKAVLGKWTYPLGGALGLLQPDQTTLRFHAQPGDFTWEGSVYSFAVGNGRLAGGGFTICPQAQLDDGLLDLVILPRVPAGQLADLAQDSFDYQQGRSTRLIVAHRCAQLTIQADATLNINLDGEPVEGRQFTLDLLPKALKLITPTEKSPSDPHQMGPT